MAHPSERDLLTLKHRSQRTQTQLDHACASLKVLEGELEHFLMDYYEAIGRDVQTLVELEQQLASVSRDCFGLKNVARDDGAARDAAHNELKQFYREMAKECHPDRVAREGGAIAQLKEDIMKTLNHAYARQSISEMWQIKWELERTKNGGKLNHKQRLELFTRQHGHMRKSLQEIEQRYMSVKESPAYQLMEYAQSLKLCGQDFLSLAKAHIARQISATRKQLLCARLQQRYWGHVRVERAEGAASG